MPRVRASCAALSLAMSLCALGGGCSRTTNLVGANLEASGGTRAMSTDADAASALDAGGAFGGRDAGAQDAGVSRMPTWGDAGVPMCGKRPCACSNGGDDDGDALSDAEDPECIGPADDDELTFATGAEHVDDGACQDCFFDGNSGAGNDGCRRAASCSTLGDASEGSGACRSCDIGARCVDRCRPLTPNGCDCFGCCAVQLVGGQSVHVMMSGACSMATLDDPAACPRCTQAADCTNPCDVCELCLGKGPAELPAPCASASGDPAGPRNTCGDGEAICDAAHPCSSGSYCQWGCCIPIVF
jgi:hypothetical protein